MYNIGHKSNVCYLVINGLKLVESTDADLKQLKTVKGSYLNDLKRGL